jgi:phosphonate transport system substrate-binding protein
MVNAGGAPNAEKLAGVGFVSVRMEVTRMYERSSRLLLAGTAGGLALLTVLMLAWLATPPGDASAVASDQDGFDRLGHGAPVRIGLTPERDVFEQRRRYRTLADYLAVELNRPVELVTARSYMGILSDFEEGVVDAAFLGSLVTLLSVDRLGTQVVAKPQLAGGATTYRGVIFVTPDSPVQSIEDLAGRSIAMVRSTTGGNLFPICEMVRRGMFSSDHPPQIVWVGTHDDVIHEVMAGRADAGGMKDLRLDSYENAHPRLSMRRLAISEPVPENALVVRADLDIELAQRLEQTLMGMDQDPAGRQVLQQFGAQRFVSCSVDEYGAIYDMVEWLGTDWERVGVPGPPPRRPGQQEDRTEHAGGH